MMSRAAMPAGICVRQQGGIMDIAAAWASKLAGCFLM